MRSPSHTGAVIVFVTVPDQTAAETLSRAVVGERLAACVSILRSVTSVYRWKGSICRDTEVLLMMKTSPRVFHRLEARVRELHPYDVPEIIAVPVTQGSQPYLAWLSASLV